MHVQWHCRVLARAIVEGSLRLWAAPRWAVCPPNPTLSPVGLCAPGELAGRAKAMWPNWFDLLTSWPFHLHCMEGPVAGAVYELLLLG